jgi:DNA-directed RNA polymerase subunit RPC12/RpoP
MIQKVIIMGGGGMMEVPSVTGWTQQPATWGEVRSPHVGHKHHLCAMAESGDVGLEQMKDLVRNPKFMCKRCGRAAKSADNLCEPVSMDYICGMCGATFSSKAKMMDHTKTHKD